MKQHVRDVEHMSVVTIMSALVTPLISENSLMVRLFLATSGQSEQCIMGNNMAEGVFDIQNIS